MTLRRTAPAILLAGFTAACALYSEVSISGLILIPSEIEHGSDIHSMLRKSDYLRALSLAPVIDGRAHPTAQDLGALGQVELAAGRYDEARKHLRAAIDLDPFRTSYARIAWDLAQVEYMTNNYAGSLEWSRAAQNHGINVKQWHLDYLAALASTDVYRMSGKVTERLPMSASKPDVPRIEVRLNGDHPVQAVVDSGAVLSILSERFAATLPVRSLGDVRGTFFGLLGEPITVRFALLDSIQAGGLRIENVPVAIMPDEKMKFVVTGSNDYRIDFLLGANLLKELKIELDFLHGTLLLTRLTSADRVPDPEQNLFIDGFRPVVRGTINRHGWFLFTLDTGSEVTFLNETQLAALPVQLFSTTKIHGAMLQGLGGAMKHGAKVDNIELGVDRWAGTFRTLPMYGSTDRDKAVGIVGENFLKNFRVVIDFGRMRVDLHRS